MTSPTPKAVIAKASFVQKITLLHQSIEDIRKFGYADENGHAFVIVEGVEHPVGQYALPDGNGTQDATLKYFGRKFDNLASQVTLLEQRAAAKKYVSSMSKEVQDLQERAKTYDGIGDYAGLQKRLEILADKVTALEQEYKEHLQQAREEEIARREALIAQAAKIAAKDPENVQWKEDTLALQHTFEQWQDAQKNGMRLGKHIDDSMWNRMRSARSQFDAKRRTFFSGLEATNKIAKQTKEALIQKAEELSVSQNWDETAKEFKNLMSTWRQTPRANKKDDEKLWERFRAAQSKFFDALQAHKEQTDAEYTKNLSVKEELLKEARALLPVEDIGKTKQKLRVIQQKWEETGRIPRTAVEKTERELHTIQKAIERAEEKQWKETDPVLAERTSSMLSQLQESISELEQKLAEAEAAHDGEAVETMKSALNTRQAWLKNIQKN